jgi:hypothetical protein
MPNIDDLKEPIKSGGAGLQQDKLLECLDNIHKKLDSIEAEDKRREDARRDKKRRDGDAEGGDSDTLADKMQALDDAIEAGDKEEIEKAHEALKEHLRADGKKRKDANRRKDDDEDLKKPGDYDPKDDRYYGEPKKVMADSLIADNKRRELMAELQSRADSVANHFGEEAPRPMSGERPNDYRRRLLRKFLCHSKVFKDVDINTIPSGPAFDAFETQVFADAVTAANDRQSLNASATGFLRKVIKTDETGRPITEYFGRPRMWLEQFCCPAKRLVCINNGSRAVRPSEIIG